MNTHSNPAQIIGCMTGLAAGDALGGSVTSLSAREISEKYPPSGITNYVLDPTTEIAHITADAQMALFAANGILYGETRACMRGIAGPASAYIEKTLRDWYKTQVYSMEQAAEKKPISWLLNVPELYAERGPGKTCMDILSKLENGEKLPSPINNSKGCGGLVRVIPMALHSVFYTEHAIEAHYLETQAAQVAQITHGHPISGLTAAFLTHLIRRIILSEQSITDCIMETILSITRTFGSNEHSQSINALICRALSLVDNATPDPDNIRSLGDEWTADQVLAIALYCAAKYENDFSAGLIASVNHDSISNVTGAITGAILGAKLGTPKIDYKWINHLELLPIFKEIARDLAEGCPLSEYSGTNKRFWYQKYWSHQYKGDDLS